MMMRPSLYALIVLAILATSSGFATGTTAVQAGQAVTAAPAAGTAPVFATTRVLYDRQGNLIPEEGLGRGVDVDLSTQQLSAFEGDEAVRSMVASTGTHHHPTITGQFRIYEKFPITTMTGPGYSVEKVPYTMYFYQGYSIHGAYWHDDFGTPSSHGCVQLSPEEAAWLYDWASIGTLVYIHY